MITTHEISTSTITTKRTKIYTFIQCSASIQFNLYIYYLYYLLCTWCDILCHFCSSCVVAILNAIQNSFGFDLSIEWSFQHNRIFKMCDYCLAVVLLCLVCRLNSWCLYVGVYECCACPFIWSVFRFFVSYSFICGIHPLQWPCYTNI